MSDLTVPGTSLHPSHAMGADLHRGQPLWVLAAMLSKVEEDASTQRMMSGYRIRATAAEARQAFLELIERDEPGFVVDSLTCIEVPPTDLRLSLGLPEPASSLTATAEMRALPNLLSISRAVVSAWHNGRIQAVDQALEVPDAERALSDLHAAIQNHGGNGGQETLDNTRLLTAAEAVVLDWQARRMTAAGAPSVALGALRQMVALHHLVAADVSTTATAGSR